MQQNLNLMPHLAFLSAAACVHSSADMIILSSTACLCKPKYVQTCSVGSNRQPTIFDPFVSHISQESRKKTNTINTMQMEIDQWINKLDLIFILFDIREHATTTNVPHTPQHVHVNVECEQNEEK